MASFIVSARKYRPTRFSEVIGQQQVTQTLQRALQKDRIAQAFLFCGPHGVGKTTCARILAKTLNCQDLSESHEPCGQCQSCRSFEENASFNIIELDAASNNSVEHIRQLTEQVRFAPQQGKYKVFIIDEVHMLSSAAFNAFLKTLEEPPPYAVFILATTEKHKILPTILSRCQIFDFRRIQSQDIVSALKGIMGKEDIHVSEEALHLIAQKANGAMRDALSLYDKIVSSVGNQIEKSDVIEHLSLLDQAYYFEVVQAMMSEQVTDVLMAFAKIIRLGFHPEIFVQGLLEHFRNLLLCQDEKTTALLDTSQVIKTKYLEQGSIISISLVMTALDLLNQCYLDIPRATNKELHVEICLSKICFASRKISGNLFGESHDSTISEPTPQKKKPKQISSEISSTEKPQIKSDHKSNPSTNADPAQDTRSLTESEQSISDTSNQPQDPPPQVGAVIDLNAIKNIQSQVREELQKTKTYTPVTLQALESAWNIFAEEHVQIASTKIIFKQAILELEDSRITVRVANKLQKYSIQDEKALVKYLRETLNNEGIQMRVQVDRSLEPEIPTQIKPTTPKEIYEHLKQINPAITELVDALSLSPDSDPHN